MRRIRFSIRGLIVAVAVVAVVVWAWRVISGISFPFPLGRALFLLAMWIGLFALLLWGAFRYDRESPEGRTRLIWLLGLATFAVVAIALFLPVLDAARRIE